MFLIARDRRVLPAIWSRSNVDRGKPYYSCVFWCLLGIRTDRLTDYFTSTTNWKA